MRTFSVSPAAPGAARRAIDALVRAVSPELLHDLRLIVSELVTNAVQHSGMSRGDKVRLKLELSSHNLRVEVIDRGRGFTPELVKRSDERRHGLDIVDKLASRWGSETGADTRVWAELAVPVR